MKEEIYHITSFKAWEKAKSTGTYADDRLLKDGFIHCSYARQLIFVANSIFKGQNSLLLLGIKRSKLSYKVIDEDLYNLNDLYPHIYGPVQIDAIFEVIPFPCNDDGFFELPGRLKIIRGT